jgi:hypothetical protein
MDELEWRHCKGDADEEGREWFRANGYPVPERLLHGSSPYECWTARADTPFGYVDLRLSLDGDRWRGHLDIEGGSVVSEPIYHTDPEQLKSNLTRRLGLLLAALGASGDGE